MADGATTMTVNHGTPLPLCAEDELDLQVGKDLVRQVGNSIFGAIRSLRLSLHNSGKTLALVRVRDNPSMPPHAFVLRRFGAVIAEGKYPSDGDILQALTCTAVPTPPPPIVAQPEKNRRYFVTN